MDYVEKLVKEIKDVKEIIEKFEEIDWIAILDTCLVLQEENQQLIKQIKELQSKTTD